MIHATFPAQAGKLLAGDSPLVSRTVTGIAVPWMTPGRVQSGETVIFHPGALDAAARPVGLRDHDRTRTIGRVADASDDGQQMHAAVKVSKTPLGDETLVLAADGNLMFSVGAEPTKYHYDSEGVMHVEAAEWNELTLLPLGAYAGAVITQVAASQGGAMGATLTDPTTTASDAPDDAPPDDPPTPDDDETTPPSIEAGATVVPLQAQRGSAPRQRQQSKFQAMSLRDVARVIAASRGGDINSVALRDAVLAAQGPVAHGIQAALADITMVGTDNIGAQYRPAYQAELIDIISWGTPLIDVLRQGDLQRGDYPNVSFNAWTKTPEVRLQAAEKDEIHSVPVSIGPASAPVQTWAGGNDISQQELDFGSPSFVEDYIRAAGMDYARQADTYAATALLTAAAPVATAAADPFILVLQKLISALDPATTPPGGLFCAVSFNVGASLIGVTQQNGPAFWSGKVNFGKMTADVTNDAGLTVFVDPNMPANTYLLGHKQGATWYDLPGTPFNLRAVNVGLLGLDVAVYGYGAIGIQFDGAFVKTTPV